MENLTQYRKRQMRLTEEEKLIEKEKRRLRDKERKLRRTEEEKKKIQYINYRSHARKFLTDLISDEDKPLFIEILRELEK
ncbi:hypothetical protein KMP11_02830 [Gemella sp. zg-570]|uniref:hypothetical protein n=1 Tax=Gemella sp. zg-570 TaxID=2840371 RepID=UPI001C0DAB8C|nr:hypothetical protein [Gemella sp. zg-570]QWQ39276.1 hypothetical protein KMP11_02830 [Gemella sp. zg-570]